MNLFSVSEVLAAYAKAGKQKTAYSAVRQFLLAVLAGLFIALGAAVANTASHGIANVSMARVLSGLLFPFGLGMVVLLGAELFTGNTLLAVSVLNQNISLGRMLRNWGLVYAGNFAGALLLAAGCAWFGQLNGSDGALAVYTIKLAAAKCALPFWNGVVLGVFCNVLVCAGVLCGLTAKDTVGRIAGVYIPVAFFVICGFEHSVANMYYVPAGIFALRVPGYAALAAGAGLDAAALTWENFLWHNLLPVTMGNIIGGAGLGSLLWYCHHRREKETV